MIPTPLTLLSTMPDAKDHNRLAIQTVAQNIHSVPEGQEELAAAIPHGSAGFGVSTKRLGSIQDALCRKGCRTRIVRRQKPPQTGEIVNGFVDRDHSAGRV